MPIPFFRKLSHKLACYANHLEYRWSALQVICVTPALSQPASSFSQEELQAILKVVTSSEFCDKSPRQIVPELADRGVYLGSESTIYRLLKSEKLIKLMKHRGKSRPPRKIEVVSTSSKLDHVILVGCHLFASSSPWHLLLSLFI